MKNTFHYRKLIFFISSLFFFNFFSYSQINEFEKNKLVKDFEELSSKKASVQIYIQTNKDIYETGEDLWFKAYILDSKLLTPSNIDQTLYVQMEEEDTGQIVWQEKYKIEGGYSHGHVHVNDSLISGNYLISAYTPHSFYKDSKTFYDSRRILVKKNADPRIIVNHTFDKLYYKQDDTLQLNLEVLSKKKELLSRADIEGELWSEGAELTHVVKKTNRDGQALMSFYLKEEVSNLKIKLRVSHKEKEEFLKLSIPFNKKDKLQFNLFPEGGYLLTNLQNRVAFKAVNIKGQPADIEGVLYEDNIPIVNIKSRHYGMGDFYFTPKAKSTYHIKLRDSLKEVNYTLPKIKEKGISMQLKRKNKEFLIFDIRDNRGNLSQNLYIRVQIRGVVYNISQVIVKGKEELIAKIPVKDLPQGIAEVTLFNENFLPIVERLVYVNPHKKLSIEVTPEDGLYERREKVHLKIKVMDEDGNPVQGNFGLSVYDKLYQDENNKINILTYNYLRTQLRGKIYNPSYYFNERNEDREAMLDLLMLTQGWRNYVWNENELKNIGDGNLKVVSNDIKGEIKIVKQELLNDQFTLSIFDPSENKILGFVPLDNTRRFALDIKALDNGKGNYMYLRPFSSSKKFSKSTVPKIFIKMESAFDIIEKEMKNKDRLLSIKSIEEIEEYVPEPFVLTDNTIVNEEVLIIADNKTFRDKYLGDLSDSKHNAIIGSNDYVCEYDVLNCVNHGRNTFGAGKPILGVEYYYNGGDERAAKILPRNRARYIGLQENLTEEELLKKFNLTLIEGYYKVKEFYEPNYDEVNDPIPDFRNTLTWQPNIITDEKGEAKLTFFCSDINTKFIGNIEGIDNNGLLGTESFEFVVRQ